MLVAAAMILIGGEVSWLAGSVNHELSKASFLLLAGFSGTRSGINMPKNWSLYA